MKVALIVAIDLKNGISKNNKIPWINKNDMMRFKKLTSTALPEKINCVIYGKNTFLELPQKAKCLPNRHNIIVSSTLTDDIIKKENYTKQSYSLFKTLKESIDYALGSDFIDKVFICGGSQIYTEAIKLNVIDTFYITVMKQDYSCDNFYDMNLQKEYLGNKFIIKKEIFDDYEFHDYCTQNDKKS